MLEPTNLIESSENELLPVFAQSLVESYDELSAEGMLKEIARLGRFLKAAKITREESLGWSSIRFLEFIIKYEPSDSLPNLTLGFLRFFLTSCVSVSSCERRFFKLIMNYLRPTMNKARLSNLGLFLIENCVAESTNFL